MLEIKSDDGFVGITQLEKATPVKGANACKNAKFKVGDKVTDGSGVYLITGIDNGFGSYEWKLISGRGDPSYSEGGNFNWADSKMKLANSCARNDRVKGHFVWFAPWNGRAGEAADEIVAKVPGAKREGANIVRVKDADSAATVYALFRKAKVPTRDLNIGFNSSSACNAKACKNAKFIKGDFVKVKGWPGTFRIDIVNPDGTYVLKKYPSGQPTIGSYKESELELEEANAKACNSRNPIVAKALNAVAKNYKPTSEFEGGTPWKRRKPRQGEYSGKQASA
jgi:hypothetical protein